MWIHISFFIILCKWIMWNTVNYWNRWLSSLGHTLIEPAWLHQWPPDSSSCAIRALGPSRRWRVRFFLLQYVIELLLLLPNFFPLLSVNNRESSKGNFINPVTFITVQWIFAGKVITDIGTIREMYVLNLLAVLVLESTKGVKNAL